MIKKGKKNLLTFSNRCSGPFEHLKTDYSSSFSRTFSNNFLVPLRESTVLHVFFFTLNVYKFLENFYNCFL